MRYVESLHNNVVQDVLRYFIVVQNIRNNTIKFISQNVNLEIVQTHTKTNLVSQNLMEMITIITTIYFQDSNKVHLK